MSAESHAQSGGEGDRWSRVEEGVAFNERAIEQLSGEIAEMNKRMQALTKRLAALEERLGKVEEPEEED